MQAPEIDFQKELDLALQAIDNQEKTIQEMDKEVNGLKNKLNERENKYKDNVK